ncbi:hypothetical protein GQ55_3G373400 [Panicum hallii var. hallii]|uniref:Uncharacterized protein n=1 Tax=Panicum hallii var. hallii TaxID=1504633 RepID=A0A2T7EG85_9POAL|nr:hypothetical protein GQ55_3G373400 [Panicum hallii var. hallii]
MRRPPLPCRRAPPCSLRPATSRGQEWKMLKTNNESRFYVSGRNCPWLQKRRKSSRAIPAPFPSPHSRAFPLPKPRSALGGGGGGSRLQARAGGLSWRRGLRRGQARGPGPPARGCGPATRAGARLARGDAGCRGATRCSLGGAGMVSSPDGPHATMDAAESGR